MKSFSATRFTIAVLVSLLIAYLVLFSCSKDTEDKQDIAECYKLADEHWSEDAYKQWLIDSLDITSDTARYWDPELQEWRYLPFNLPEEKNQQYYQMIGKYEQFLSGWDDYDHETGTSQNRQIYSDCLARADGGSSTSPTGPEGRKCLHYGR